MSERRTHELQWPQVCIGCGNPADIIQEELIQSKEGIQTCKRCDKIGRMEHLSNKGWNLVFGLFAFIIVMDLTLIIGGNLLISTLVGLIAIIPPLYFDGVFSRIYSYDSYVGLKASNTLEFRNRIYLNLFAASNPSIEAVPSETTPSRKVDFFRIISTFIVFTVVIIISLIIIAVIPNGAFLLEFHLLALLLAPWYVGPPIYFLLVRISKNYIIFTFPDSSAISEIPQISPTLQPGRIASAAQWDVESNIAIHKGQKTVLERAKDAIEQNDFTDAIRLYKKAIDMNPTELDAWTGIALAYAKADRYIESRDAIHRAQGIAPDNAEVQSILDECASICGMDFSRESPSPPIVEPPVSVSKDDEQIFRKQIDEDPMNPKVWAGLAVALAKSGRCFDARDALQRAKDIDATEPDIWSVLDECRTHCETVFNVFGKEDKIN